MRDFGLRLKAAVAASDYTQKALAERLGVEPATVSKWANGHALPSGDYMVQLPNLLDVDGHWLLTGEGGPDRHRQDPSDAQRALMRIREALGDDG